MALYPVVGERRRSVRLPATLATAKNKVGYGHLYQGRFKSFPAETDEHFYSVVLAHKYIASATPASDSVIEYEYEYRSAEYEYE